MYGTHLFCGYIIASRVVLLVEPSIMSIISQVLTLRLLSHTNVFQSAEQGYYYYRNT